ncbi:hypothetical protein DPMN_145405 [Dreissena polymorpha]|uniref:Uncharacterized protein n=1 Tax=Dreissena polymorpha TaxID=45954 RepID=A0A9D4IYS3_DREPO|nr:hypothetical protein DPMN_145405 [Dreissena polymorpha]
MTPRLQSFKKNKAELTEADKEILLESGLLCAAESKLSIGRDHALANRLAQRPAFASCGPTIVAVIFMNVLEMRKYPAFCIRVKDYEEIVEPALGGGADGSDFQQPAYSYNRCGHHGDSDLSDTGTILGQVDHFISLLAVHGDVCTGVRLGVNHDLRLLRADLYPYVGEILKFTAGATHGVNVNSDYRVEDGSSNGADRGVVVIENGGEQTTLTNAH